MVYYISKITNKITKSDKPRSKVLNLLFLPHYKLTYIFENEIKAKRFLNGIGVSSCELPYKFCFPNGAVLTVDCITSIPKGHRTNAVYYDEMNREELNKTKEVVLPFLQKYQNKFSRF